jgi:agmatinase
MIVSVAGLLVLSTLVTGHGDHGQSQLAGPHQGLWYNTLPGDGGTQVSTPIDQHVRYKGYPLTKR